MRRFFICSGVLALVACSDATPMLTKASGGMSVGSTTTGDAPTSDSSTSATSSTSGSTGDKEDVFQALECDQWTEDCPRGEKCNPWANDGGSAWNATKCVPVAEDPKGPGEPCTVEGNGVSGIDDCELHAMCWDVDPETDMGTCVAKCIGSPADPSCEDPCMQCTIYGAELILCLQPCNPLLQDCVNDNLCIDFEQRFVCVLDASGDSGAYGAPCEYTNACDAGLFCADAVDVPGCTDPGCCSEYCDISDPAGDAQCSGVDQGQVCVPYYEDPSSVCPDLQDVGKCQVP